MVIFSEGSLYILAGSVSPPSNILRDWAGQGWGPWGPNISKKSKIRKVCPPKGQKLLKLSSGCPFVGQLLLNFGFPNFDFPNLFYIAGARGITERASIKKPISCAGSVGLLVNKIPPIEPTIIVFPYGWFSVSYSIFLLTDWASAAIARHESNNGYHKR